MAGWLLAVLLPVLAAAGTLVGYRLGYRHGWDGADDAWQDGWETHLRRDHRPEPSPLLRPAVPFGDTPGYAPRHAVPLPVVPLALTEVTDTFRALTADLETELEEVT